MFNNRNRLISTVSAAVLAATAAVAHAEVYQASTWLGMTSAVTTKGFIEFADNVKQATGGAIEFETQVGGVLLPAAETLQGVGQGVAALGQITAAYTPADLPINNVLGDLGFIATDSFVAPFAMADVRINNPKARGEWEKHNIVYGASFSTSAYHFACTEPVTSIEDVRGLQIRASLGAQVDFLNSVGAVPVSVPGGDIYSGLERGSIDCSLMSDESMIGLKLIEVVKHVTRLPMGVFVGGATWGFNRDFWSSISEEQRRIILDNLAVALVRTQIGLREGDKQAFEQSADYGIEWHEPGEDMKEALASFTQDFVDDLPEASMEKRGVEDPTDLVNAFVEAEKKWTELLEGVDRTDEEALVAIVKREIFDKLDVSTYGVK